MLKKGEIHGWPWWSGMLVIIGVPAHTEAAKEYILTSFVRRRRQAPSAAEAAAPAALFLRGNMRASALPAARKDSRNHLRNESKAQAFAGRALSRGVTLPVPVARASGFASGADLAMRRRTLGNPRKRASPAAAA